MMGVDRSRVVLSVIAGAVVVLVVIAVVIALQPPELLDPSTPEGAAQGYFQALHDGDKDGVAMTLTQDLVDRCDGFEHWENDHYREQARAARVVIEGTDTNGSHATVHVAITLTTGDAPFDVDSDTVHETLVMEHHGDLWLISEVPWPWDRYVCVNKE